MNAQLMTRILFATDYSDCAARAQEYATSLALAWDAGLDVLHVLEGSAWMPSNAAIVSSLERIHKDVTPQLDEIQKQIARNGVAATMRQVRGIPSEQINLTAKECGVDLVVLGAHGQVRLDSVLLGSTTEWVTKTAPCPVLAVRGVRGGALRNPTAVQSPVSIQHILVPVDFSSPSLASLEYAIQFANRLGATLTLLHVLEPVYHDLELGLGQIEQEPAKRTHWEAHLAELATLVKSFGLSADPVVCGGIPSDSILACALQRQCDLIVMGTHGRRDLSRRRFGSMAEAVLCQATCPVLTVRSPKFSPGHRRVISETAMAMRGEEHQSWTRVTSTSPSSTLPV
jgi:nucleotide-binding universal stress UspA family protein